MNFLIKILISICIGAKAVAAMPSKYQACDKEIKEPKNSSGYYWANDCSALYVMPPVNNRIRVDSSALNITDQECKIQRNVMDLHLAKIGEITRRLKDENINLREIKRLEKKIIKIAKKKERLTSARYKLIDTKGRVKIILIPIGKQLALKNKELERCHESTRTCFLVKNEIKKLKNKKNKIEIALEQVSTKLEIITEQESELAAQIFSAKNSIEGFLPAEEEALEKIRSLSNSLNEQLAEPRERVGGVIKVVMENMHTELVKAYKKKNRDIIIRKMPTQSSVQFKVEGMDGFLHEVVRHINIPGVVNTANNVMDGYTDLNFGESLTGSVDISALAACMLKMGKLSNKSQIAKFTVNLLYKYNLSSRNDYTMAYNLREIYSRIRKSTSKGGLFKTRSINSIVEETTQNASFLITFNAEDPRDNYDFKAKADLKAEFIGRSLEAMSLAYIPRGERPTLELPGARESGVQNTAKRVKKCSNYYCQMAAMALDMSHALFGNAEQSAEYLKTQDFMHTEHFIETKNYEYYGTSSFVAKVEL